MTVLEEGKKRSDWVKWVEEKDHSIDTGVLVTGQNLAQGTVCGIITKDTPTTGTADVGNTGDGTCGSVTAGPNAKLGTYTLTCTAAAADSGTFAVKAPDGSALPDATVGAAYSNSQINFTLADGATDFVVGDIFTIEVAAGSGKYTQLAPAAVDGSQVAAAIILNDVDATAGDVSAEFIGRDANVVSTQLVWPDGITAEQKATALAQLKALSIVDRVEV